MGVWNVLKAFFRRIPEAGRGSDRFPEVPDREPKEAEPKADTSLSMPDRAQEVGDRAGKSESGSK